MVRQANVANELAFPMVPFFKQTARNLGSFYACKPPKKSYFLKILNLKYFPINDNFYFFICFSIANHHSRTANQIQTSTKLLELYGFKGFCLYLQYFGQSAKTDLQKQGFA